MHNKSLAAISLQFSLIETERQRRQHQHSYIYILPAVTYVRSRVSLCPRMISFFLETPRMISYHRYEWRHASKHCNGVLLFSCTVLHTYFQGTVTQSLALHADSIKAWEIYRAHESGCQTTRRKHKPNQRVVSLAKDGRHEHRAHSMGWRGETTTLQVIFFSPSLQVQLYWLVFLRWKQIKGKGKKTLIYI